MTTLTPAIPITSLDDPRVPPELRAMILASTAGQMWWDATVNAHRGCSRVSEGCRNCHFLKAFDQRMKYQIAGAYTDIVSATFVPHKLRELAADRVPKRIFTPSDSDAFHQDLPTETIVQFLDAVRAAPWHFFMSPTKRADRLAEIGPYLDWPQNLLMMVSVEDTKTLPRIERLHESGAPRKGASLEPVIRHIDLRSSYGRDLIRPLDLVIFGGESASKRRVRPMDIEWAREIAEVCREEGVPVFFKQVGSVDFAGRYVGKKKAGRQLDGETFDDLARGCLDHLVAAWAHYLTSRRPGRSR